MTSAMSICDPRTVLERALVRLQAPAAALEQRLEAGDYASAPYCEAIEALAMVAPRLEPSARDERRDRARQD